MYRYDIFEIVWIVEIGYNFEKNNIIGDFLSG